MANSGGSEILCRWLNNDVVLEEIICKPPPPPRSCPLPILACGVVEECVCFVDHGRLAVG